MSMATMERRRALVGSRRRRNQNANRSRGQNTRNGRGTPRSRRRFGCQRSRKGGGLRSFNSTTFSHQKNLNAYRVKSPRWDSLFFQKEFAARKIFVINTLKSFLLDRTVSNMSVPVGLRVGFFFHFVTSLTWSDPNCRMLYFLCERSKNTDK